MPKPTMNNFTQKSWLQLRNAIKTNLADRSNADHVLQPAGCYCVVYATTLGGFGFALGGNFSCGCFHLFVARQVIVFDWLQIRVQLVHQRDTCIAIRITAWNSLSY